MLRFASCFHRRLAVLSLLALITARAPAESSSAAPLPDPAHFYLFLLIGQSNMAGRGPISPADQLPMDRVLKFNAGGKWVPAVDPLHFDKAIAGVGLGRSFAAEIARDHPDVTIGLIPCAVGGSPIAAWQSGALYRETGAHPWDDALRRARAALPDGTLKGILWHQGESDAHVEKVAAYEAELIDLVARWRVALKAPEVPFIVGQMGRFEGKPWTEYQEQVDAATRALVDAVPYTAYVSAEGLLDRGDKIHFSTPSYYEFGRRYAEAYRKLTDRN